MNSSLETEIYRSFAKITKILLKFQKKSTPTQFLYRYLKISKILILDYEAEKFNSVLCGYLQNNPF